MPRKRSAAALDAKYGERMIEVKVRFWTNDIAEGRGRIVPKHAWASGVVRVKGNRAHGIRPAGVVRFRSLLDLPGAIEKVLIDHGVELHTSVRMRKYLSDFRRRR
jgi:hypothetical protein